MCMSSSTGSGLHTASDSSIDRLLKSWNTSKYKEGPKIVSAKADHVLQEHHVQ